ncbi:unnamed protein product [Victoria cruziana]
MHFRKIIFLHYRSQAAFGCRFLNTVCQVFDQVSEKETFLQNKRVSEHFKFGSVGAARKAFDGMPVRDVITWNAMISGYRRNGLVEAALEVYIRMNREGIKGNASTFSSVLAVCSDVGALQLGSQVHCLTVLLGFELSLFVGSALVHFYMHSLNVDNAIKMFGFLPERNLATWNTMLSGLSRNDRRDQLFEMLIEMRNTGMKPNKLSYCYIIHGCDHEGMLDQGRQVHCHMIKSGLAESDLFIANALVDMYSSCGCLLEAIKSFEVLESEDVISWNSIVSIHASHGYVLRALDLFRQMRHLRKSPTVRSLIELLCCSGNMQDVQLGEQIHGQAIRLGFNDSVHIRSALIIMYGKCTDIRSCERLFDDVARRSLVCYNALISSYAKSSLEENAIETFKISLREKLRPDQFTVSAILKSCTSMVASEYSEQFHCFVIKTGLLGDMAVSVSLIDSYSKSGNSEISRQIFHDISELTTTSVTAIISAYARNGLGREALELFEYMLLNGLVPDDVTLLAVLSACNHAGLVEEGLAIFESMTTCYEVTPDRRHYSCIINLLGRAGMLEEAVELMNASTVEGDAKLWSAILGACRIHRNLKVGERAAEALMELEPECPATYLQVCDLYNASGDLEIAAKIRSLEMRKWGRTDCGYSLIETKG